MKIVVKNINDGDNEYLVYLKTDDEISIKAEFANKDTYQYIIDDLIEESGEEAENVEIFNYTLTGEDLTVKKEVTMNEQPLILVFYINRDVMSNGEIIQPFVDSVNSVIGEREANAMAFFLPTDDNERIECINPLIATDDEKSRIGELIDDISKNFDIGQGADDDYDDYDELNIINRGDED